ncbi:MAG: hypothetical protein PF440_02500 [Thiomicrorhabdus sp.]|jgi:hypothetical protein|nr:hypothetical protein [Thiomicrorhabdus sp.]
MNLGAAISEITVQAMSYEPTGSKSTSMEAKVDWQDVMGMISTLPSKGEKALVEYALDVFMDNEEVSNPSLQAKAICAVESVKAASHGFKGSFKQHKIACDEIDAVVNKKPSVHFCEFSGRVNRILSSWESDFLYRLREI